MFQNLSWKSALLSALVAAVTATLVMAADSRPDPVTATSQSVALTSPYTSALNLQPLVLASAVDQKAAREGVADATRLSAAFEHVADVIRPSVVSVRVTAKPNPQALRRAPSPLFDFFGDRLGPFGQFGQPPVRQGAGTGFVVSEDGYILTNNHVVDQATEVEVELGGKIFQAEVVGSDPQTDLSVLKIDADGLVPVTFGSSDELRVGQWVVAVGDPFGLAESITAGIVSAKGRSRVGLTDYEDFIQTDAAINPGNSGGPLVDLHGRVVGVNTAIASRSGGYQGIGFAIPSDLATSVMDDLISDGRVVRGWLGVTIQDLDEDLARSFDREDPSGALVGDVQDASPADKAGLQSGDIVLEYDGRAVEDTNQLRLLVAATKPGERVALDVFRDGRRKQLEVKIGELEATDAGFAGSGAGSSEVDLGMSWRTLTDEIAGQLGYEVNPGGVVLTNVTPFSAASKAGLRARDVVLAVGGEEVTDAREFTALIGGADLERGVRLTVLSSGSQRFAFLRG